MTELKKGEWDVYEEATIQCDQCGTKICFYPRQVMYLRGCPECDNHDHGSCRLDWPENRFGNFTLVDRKVVRYYIDTPIGRRYF